MMSFLNLYNKVFAIVISAMLFFTGGLNSIFNGDIYEFSSVDSVIGVETLTRSQGVTTDGESWIFSGKTYLERVSLDSSEILALNTEAIPSDLAESFGSAHIGGISYNNGLIYAAVEDSKQWQHPLVVLYDAKTLEYTGTYYELPAENHTRGVPWVLVDGDNGIVYAGDSRNPNSAFKYDAATFEYLGTLDFSEPVSAIQGGEYYNGVIYLGTNDITRAVYSVDAESGTVTKLFDRIMYAYKYIDNFGGEGEGLTVLPMEDGTFIHTLQLGTLFVDSTLRHYAWS